MHKNLPQFGLMDLLEKTKGIILCEPHNYVSFMNLVFNCRMVITDSGGIPEETTYLGITCLTMRPNTERPITIPHGTNRLCSLEDIQDKATRLLFGKREQYRVPELWDGKKAARVVDSIKFRFLNLD